MIISNGDAEKSQKKGMTRAKIAMEWHDIKTNQQLVVIRVAANRNQEEEN